MPTRLKCKNCGSLEIRKVEIGAKSIYVQREDGSWKLDYITIPDSVTFICDSCASDQFPTTENF